MNGCTAGEPGDNPGKVIMTNKENFMKPKSKKPELTAEQAQKKHLPFETTAGQSPEMQRYLNEHRING